MTGLSNPAPRSTAALTADSPIGVFDSGVGGLSVLLHLRRLLPNENYLYLADTLHVPYGSRTQDNIEALTIAAVDWLLAQGCKLIVIACNSASAYGLTKARQHCPQIPIVGLVPALKPAVLGTKTGQVAVLATPATLAGNLLNEVIDTFAIPANVTVHKHSIASLVPWVEAGMPSEHIAVNELGDLLLTLCDNAVDYLVLGCTHYPFFKQYLVDKMAKIPAFMRKSDDSQTAKSCLPIELIDSGRAIAQRVQSLLHKQQRLNTQLVPAALNFFSTANQAATYQIASKLIGQFEPDWHLEFYDIDYASQPITVPVPMALPV